jgi:hypothetical protein
MSTTPWLNAEEVRELTGLKRWSAQARALSRIGVPFTLNAQGRPLVERARVLKHRERQKITEPDWAA